MLISAEACRVFSLQITTLFCTLKKASSYFISIFLDQYPPMMFLELKEVFKRF